MAVGDAIPEDEGVYDVLVNWGPKAGSIQIEIERWCNDSKTWLRDRNITHWRERIAPEIKELCAAAL